MQYCLKKDSRNSLWPRCLLAIMIVFSLLVKSNTVRKVHVAQSQLNVAGRNAELLAVRCGEDLGATRKQGMYCLVYSRSAYSQCQGAETVRHSTSTAQRLLMASPSRTTKLWWKEQSDSLTKKMEMPHAHFIWVQGLGCLCDLHGSRAEVSRGQNGSSVQYN